MARPRVFVTRDIFPEALDAMREVADVDLWTDEMPPPRDVLLERSAGVDGILCLLNDAIDVEFFDAAGPQLKVVSQIAVGYNNIDIDEATRRGVPVGFTPDVLTDTTADFAFTLLMSAARLIVPGHTAAHNGSWRTWHPLHFLGQDIHHATLGIVGMGRIGFEMARRSAGFDIADYIVTYHSGGEELASVWESFGHYIRQETLSEKLVEGPPPDGAYTEEQKIDGVDVTLGVIRRA